MEISTSSVRNISYLLEPFSNSLAKGSTGEQGSDYVVGIEVYSYSYEGSEEGSLTDLHTLLSTKCDLVGKLVEVPYTTFESTLKKYFRYTGHGAGGTFEDTDFLLEVVPVELADERYSRFAKIISQFIDLPPKKIYIYKSPKGSTFLSGYVMWSVCFVLLSQGQGLVIVAGASD